MAFHTHSYTDISIWRYLYCVFLLTETFCLWRENDTEWRDQLFHVGEHQITLGSSGLTVITPAFNEPQGRKDLADVYEDWRVEN